MSTSKSIELRVQGMSCQHCVRAVTQALQSIDANAVVSIDLPKGLVEIQSDRLTEDEAKTAIAEEGYTVQG